MRSFEYDGIHLTIEQTEKKMNSQRIIKSMNATSLQEIADAETDGLCKLLNDQFLSAKKDYDAGKLNMVRYKIVLSKIKAFLTNSDKKDNKFLNTELMANECQRFAV